MRKPDTTPTPDSILFSQLRSMSYGVVKDAPEFKAWLKAKHPDWTFHHVCASTGNRKSTDYLGVMVPAFEHSMKQKDQEWLRAQIVPAVKNLIEYVVELEKANNMLVKMITGDKLKEQSHA